MIRERRQIINTKKKKKKKKKFQALEEEDQDQDQEEEDSTSYIYILQEWILAAAATTFPFQSFPKFLFSSSSLSSLLVLFSHSQLPL